MKESGTMKLKKWLSRALVLAMVVALMIPVPVAAKSSGGGKLVKSVTYYTVDGSGQGWEVARKVTYKYGKKNTPAEYTNTSYTTFLGIPVRGDSDTYKVKYGKKSAKKYDTAGFVMGKDTFKGGNLVSWSSDSKWSEKRKNETTGAVTDWAAFNATVGHASYFKNGLMKAEDSTESYADSDNDNYAYTENAVYAWTQKKGVPSMMVKTSVKNGTEQFYDYYEDKVYVEKYDGKAKTEYAIFNAKGFVVESGNVEDGKNVPDTAYTYTMKKGKVDTVVIYSVEDGKPTPQRMMKFAYTKKSVSKTYNLKVINSLVGCEGFRWF
jgi:hypothetical protein